MFTFIECIFVEITQQFTKNTIVGCVYRPPNTDIVMFNTELSKFLDSINVNSTNLAISDHFSIAIHFDTLFLKPKLGIEYSKPLYNPQTIESFRIALSEVDWSAICRLSTECENPSKCYSLFINKYLELFHDHFPTRSRRLSNKSTPRHD